MKKKIILLFAAVFMLSACGKLSFELDDGTGVSERTTTEQANGANAQEPAEEKAPSELVSEELTLLIRPGLEREGDILKKQLEKAGFTVKEIIPDDEVKFYAELAKDSADVVLSYEAPATDSNYDMYKSISAYVPEGDAKLTEVINDAVSDKDENAGFSRAEICLTDENAYMLPLFIETKHSYVLGNVLKDDSVVLRNSVPDIGAFSYAEDFDGESRALYLSFGNSEFSSFDPLKCTPESEPYIAQVFIRLISLRDGKATAKSSLSGAFAVSDDCLEYWFVLRDNVTFAQISGNHAADSKKRVGADDVLFSLERIRQSADIYGFESAGKYIKDVSIVTDLSETESSMAGGISVKDYLSAELAAPIKSLTGDKKAADSAKGIYQIIKITTVEPFNSLLPYLANASAGIVNKEQTEKSGEAVFETDSLSEGGGYGNILLASGQYMPSLSTGKSLIFERNPGFMPGTDSAPSIKTVVAVDSSNKEEFNLGLENKKVAFIGGDAVLSAETLGLADYETLTAGSTLKVFVSMGNTAKTSDVNLRKAVYYAVDQSAFFGAEDAAVPVYTVLPGISGSKPLHKPDYSKVEFYLEEYAKTKAQP